MIFAVLFILAFLFGFAVYWFTSQWITAVSLSIVIFCISAVVDQSAGAMSIKFTLLFGVPIVFFASLLGCYVVQIRTPEDVEATQTQADKEE